MCCFYHILDDFTQIHCDAGNGEIGRLSELN